MSKASEVRAGRGLALLAIAMAALACLAPSAEGAKGSGSQPQKVFAFLSRLSDRAEVTRLKEVGDKLSIVGPNWYALNLSQQTVSGPAPDPDVMSAAGQKGVAVWPVVNSQTGGSTQLDDPTVRQRVVTAISDLATRYGYAGITLDMEGVAPTQGASFTALIRDLAASLHGLGRQLAVYVPRRTSAPPSNYAAPYDWRSLAGTADLVLASGYNEHYAGGSPGPITTSAGWSDVVSYAASISTAKIAPLFGAFGYSWPRAGGTGTFISAVDADAQRTGAGISGTSSDGEITYEIGDRVVWYETGDGSLARARAAKRAGMAWVALFSLGREPLGIWRRL